MNDHDLRESLQDLFEEAPCGYIFTRPDGTFLRANGTFLDWTGYSQIDLVNGKRFQDVITVPGKIFYENQYFPLLRLQGFVREVAFDIVGKEGESLPMLVNSVQKYDASGRPWVIASTIFMATDRRAYERELLRARQEAEQLSAIVTLSADAIARCSVDGIVETWNSGAQLMFGYTESQIRDMHLRHLLPSIDDQEWIHIHAALQSRESVYLEATGRRLDGSSIDVSVGLAPHLGPLGHLDAMSAIIRDVSESKAIQRLQNEFLAMISHELRTPLTSIRGHAQLMLRRGTYVRSHLEIIVAATKQLARLVDDLLLASRLEAAHFDLRLASLDLVAVVRETVADMEGTSGRQINLNVPSAPLTIRGDQLRLGQIFANLLSNAVKYSPHNSDIEVQVTSSAGEVSVAIRDHGAGIPEDAIPHLFSRFYRVAATADHVQGAGLGLYIADRLTHAHAGHVTVESALHEGSVFTVTLPLNTDALGDSLAGVNLEQSSVSTR